jgi:hypothetical protein
MLKLSEAALELLVLACGWGRVKGEVRATNDAKLDVGVD